jgi:rubrerythrin
MDNQKNAASSDEEDPKLDAALDDILALEPKEVPKVDLEKAVSKAEEKTEASAKMESKRIRWRCRNCHYQYEGFEKLDKCPRCGKDPSYFEDVE